MSESHQREAAIFDAAIELAPSERASYLDRACAGDASLRERIEALLRAGDTSSEFLDSPLGPEGDEPTRVGISSSFEKPGDRIGRYKLLQQIGEGGCGIVYMAEQEEPVRRRVALKIIKLGMDTKSVIARFEAERQALAMMDHSNIAKVFDAGATETGRPYFVMELVRGMRITEYCDEAQLSTRARLDLFIQVCQAIQHAHQKGIIHRDIKPSNILVTVNDGMPLPKVIDFGIAKATTGQQLTDKTLFTAFEQFIGTPAYMSPEQAVITSLDIDTRSDIYSLGVLLYELLTGKTPFDAKTLLQSGFDEMRRIIREEEPSRPSTCLRALKPDTLTTVARQRQADAHRLIQSLRGDLDWIVMKALDKDRKRRYETASALAADVGHYLQDQPVAAVPPGVIYLTWKLLRRRRKGFVFAGMAAALGLLLVVVEKQRRMVHETRFAADADAWKSRNRQTKLQRNADLARMRLEEADVLGRVLDKLTLSEPDQTLAQASVTRLAERIHNGEGSDEDRTLLARFLTRHARLEAPSIQSLDSASIGVSMETVRDYNFDGVGLLIRPIVKVENKEISESDWTYATGAAGTIGVDVHNVITNAGVWGFSAYLEAQLVDDRTKGKCWIGGGQQPADYQLFGKPTRIPLAPIHRTFLKTLPTDFPVEVVNEQQAAELQRELTFVGHRLVKRRSGALHGFVKVTVPNRGPQQWARPLPVALSIELVAVNHKPLRKLFGHFVNGYFHGTSWTREFTADTVDYMLQFLIWAEDAKSLPVEPVTEVELTIRSSREVALKYDLLDQIVSLPEITKTMALPVETEPDNPAGETGRRKNSERE